MAEFFPTVDEAGRFLSTKVRSWLAGQFAGKNVEAELTGRLSQASLTTTIETITGTKYAPFDYVDQAAAAAAAGGSRTAAVALTLPGDATTDAATAVHVRLPFKIAATASRFRLHIRNYNDRDGITYPGALSFTGIWGGRHAVTADGLTGDFTAAPTRLVGAFTTPADASEYVTPWIARATLGIDAYTDYLFAFGYTSAAQSNHKGQGGCWRNTTPADASKATATTTREQQAPLDVWVEVEVNAQVPVYAYLGDSLTAGSAATLPVYDAYGTKHALAHGAIPTLYAHHGSNMSQWANTSQWKWQKYAVSKPDACLIAIGSNDIFGGSQVSLATGQTRHRAVNAAVRAQLTPNIYVSTILPRNNVTPEREAVRVAYNDWLRTLPGGAVNVFDLGASVESTTTPGTIDARYSAPDGTHLNSAGYGRNAQVITSPFARRAVEPVKAPGRPVHVLPVPGFNRRFVASQIDAPLGAAVSSWADLSGSGASLVPWNASPVLVSSGGVTAVQFNGIDQGLKTDLVMAQPHTVVAVGRFVTPTLASGGVAVMHGSTNPAGGNVVSLAIDSTGTYESNAGGTALGTVPVDDKWHVFIATYQGAGSVMRVDDHEDTGMNGTNSRTRLTLGGVEGSNWWGNVAVAEAITYPWALTKGERDALAAALKALI